jgi:hypothetical protein
MIKNKADEEPFKFTQVILNAASIDDLKLIFSEAKDKLKESTDEAQQLYQRSILILSLSITILTSIIAYVSTHLIFNLQNSLLVFSGFVLWVMCSFLKPNIKPSEYKADGTIPEYICTDGFFTNLQDETPEWHLHIHLIEAYNARIKGNRALNDTRAGNISEAIRWLYMIPPFSLLIILVFFLCF